MISNNAQSPDKTFKTNPIGHITKSDVYDIGQLVRSVRADIQHIKEQLEVLPAFPQGQRPPSALARFQNNIEKIENTFKKDDQTTQNVKKKDFSLPRIYVPKQNTQELNVPIKKILDEQKYQFLTSDPQNKVGQEMLRSKFNLPPPNQFKYGRHQGGISNIELEKLGVGQRQFEKTTKPKRILPKQFRDDPFADPPPITENDIQDGMYSLLNRGVIPKDVDLTPAFERGGKPLEIQRAIIEDFQNKKVVHQTLNRLRIKNEQQKDPASDLFLTAVGGDTEAQLRKAQETQGAIYHQNQQAYQEEENQLANQTYPNPNEYAVVPIQSSFPEDNTQNHFHDSQTSINMQQIVVRQGKIDESSNDYIHFKRQNITRWGGLTHLLQQLERLISQYPINLCYLDGQFMVKLADLEQERLSKQDLLSCIINSKQLIDVMTNPKTMFKGANGPVLAAIKIQTCWRRHKAFSAFDQLKFLMRMATIIQRKYRLYRLKMSTKAKVTKLKEASLEVWRQMQEEFKRCWPEIKKETRVEIHINSYTISEQKRMSLDQYKQRENSQIMRIFALKDPLVEIIYISPYTLTSEVQKYYQKILELTESEEPHKKFHFIVPENYVFFHSHLSLTQALLYSTDACKQILSLTENKQAYIVPGKVGDSDIKLSIALGIPILSGEPSNTSIFSTKSGAKRIFQQADIPIPVSAYDIYDRREFEAALARLIANNLDVNIWLFKIDDEFAARGHASLDADQIRTIVELRKKKVDMTEAVISRLQEVLSKVLAKKIKLAQPTLWKNWDHYMEVFCKSGGVIEAAPPLCQINQLKSPSISFLVEPDGFVKLIGSFDKFSGAEFINSVFFYPQKSLPQLDLLKICNSVGKKLYENGVIGHITIDLVSFPNLEDPKAHPFFWAVDINLELTDYASVCYFFDKLMEGQLDQHSGEYYCKWENGPENPDFVETENNSDTNSNQEKVKQLSHTEERQFMFCPFLHHPGLARIAYKTFFQMCRQEQISFDMESKTGSTFCLYDCLQSATIGMLTVGVHRKATVGFMQAALNFIQNQAGTLPVKTIGEYQGKDQLSIADVGQRIKIISRAFEKATRGAAGQVAEEAVPTSFIQTIA